MFEFIMVCVLGFFSGLAFGLAWIVIKKTWW